MIQAPEAQTTLAAGLPPDTLGSEGQVAGGVDVAAWFEAHAEFVARTVQRLSGLCSPVDDLVQEVFIIALRKRNQIGPEVPARGWLYRTAVHVVWHHRRGLARRLSAERRLASEPVPGSERADETLHKQEQARLVRHCAAQLPMSQREVFALFELEGLAGADIARLLEIPENTVWSRLHLGRKRFRELWEHARAEGRNP
ncbi:MAG: RNA polymerase sigma factor [Pseudomonadota bacterium]